MADLVHYLSRPEHYDNAPIGTEVEAFGGEPVGAYWQKRQEQWWLLQRFSARYVGAVTADLAVGAARRRLIRWGSEDSRG